MRQQLMSQSENHDQLISILALVILLALIALILWMTWPVGGSMPQWHNVPISG